MGDRSASSVLLGSHVDVPAELTAPDATGIIAVEHGLGTMDLVVRCLDPEGNGVGYVAAIPFDADTVEVVIVPGSNVSSVRVDAATESVTPQAN